MFPNALSRRGILPAFFAITTLLFSGFFSAAIAQKDTTPLSAGTIYSTLQPRPIVIAAISFNPFKPRDERVPEVTQPSLRTEIGRNSITHSFVAQIASVPTELTVRFGAGITPYAVRVRVAVNSAEVYDHTYADLPEAPTGHVFQLRQFPRKVAKGDIVSFSVTPSTAPGVDVVLPGDASAPFTMTGALAPDARAFDAVAVNPAVFRSTQGEPDNVTRMEGYYVQEFVALQTGVPAELGVHIFLNGTQVYDCGLDITVNGKLVFNKVYGRVPSVGGVSVFSLAGFSETIRAGDKVAFKVSPNTNVYFAAVANPRAGIGKTDLKNWTKTAVKFYLKK